jgi:hypothetical protein
MIRRITLEENVISVNAILCRPEFYLSLMKPLFKPSVFAQKENESYTRYISRLFNLLYHRANRDNTREAKLDSNIESALSVLGIDVIKTNTMNSRIIFKSTGNGYRVSNTNLIELVNSMSSAKKYDLEEIDESSLKIGVELEFVAYRDSLTEFISEMKHVVGSDRFVFTYMYNKNKGNAWILGTDSSVRPRGIQCNKMDSYELTSPILYLSKKEDFEELKTICSLIQHTFGGKTNKSCGTHIHMSFPVDEFINEHIIDHFAKSYKVSESSLFDKVVPEERKEDNAKYSRTVNIMKPWLRYSKLNFCNTSLDVSNVVHLEFRQLDGTLDYDKIYAWIKLQEFFIEVTLKSYYSSGNKNNPVKIELNDLITTEAIDIHETESLLKMAKMIA